MSPELKRVDLSRVVVDMKELDRYFAVGIIENDRKFSGEKFVEFTADEIGSPALQ